MPFCMIPGGLVRCKLIHLFICSISVDLIQTVRGMLLVKIR